MGAGIAYFFVSAQRTGNVEVIAAVSKDVVRADAIFTAVAVVLQPLTGLALASISGAPLTQPWLLLSLVLYVLIGCCWLPVVWLQIRMRNIAVSAATTGSALPAVYHDYYRLWTTLGWPAFLGVLLVFYLMVGKPMLWTD